MISFDDFPIVYFALGYLLAIGIVLILLLQANLPSFSRIFIGLSLLLVAFMRLPILVFNQEINPDESQMIAHAITLKHFPLYWQSVDGTTIGPLDNYALIFPSFFGFPFDYTSARIIGLLFVLGSLWFFYQSLIHFFDKTTAQLSLLPVVFFVAFTQEADFVHYSSEQLPVLLLNIGLWVLSKITSASRLKPPSLNTIFFLGVVLSMSPFAKIQVVPQAAVIGAFALVSLWNNRQFWQYFLYLIAGSLSFFGIVLLITASFGVLDDFWDYYILGNLIYASGSSLIDAIARLPFFIAKSNSFLLFLASILLCVILVGLQHKKKSFKMTWLEAFVFAWLLAALFAATKSGNDFLHYLNFCIYPFALLGAILIAHYTLKTPFKLVMAAALSLLPFLGAFAYSVVRHLPLNAYVSGASHQVPRSEVSKLILKYAHPEERLVIWGWMCRYHVETQMPQGTAENHSERCIYPHPLRQKYYARFLSDLQKNQPKVFVDAVGPNSLWLNDPTTQAHEKFPELKVFISEHYHFVGEVEHTRVYIRNTQK